LAFACDGFAQCGVAVVGRGDCVDRRVTACDVSRDAAGHSVAVERDRNCAAGLAQRDGCRFRRVLALTGRKNVASASGDREDDVARVGNRFPVTLRTEPAGLRESREAAADPRARVFVIFLDTYHTQLDGSANMRKPLVAFLDRVLGDDDLVALMTPEMAGSDIALGRKTAVIEKIVSNEWWGRRDRIAGKDPKDLLYEECVGAQRLPRQEQDRLLAEMIGRRRELATLNSMEDLMIHLGGLREERKAVMEQGGR
jgi:hypothetical protein